VGFGVWGLGFGVWGLGFRVWGLGFSHLMLKSGWKLRGGLLRHADAEALAYVEHALQQQRGHVMLCHVRVHVTCDM